MPAAFKDKKALDIVAGLQSLYDSGTEGYEIYELIKGRITLDNSVNQK